MHSRNPWGPQNWGVAGIRRHSCRRPQRDRPAQIKEGLTSWESHIADSRSKSAPYHERSYSPLRRVSQVPHLVHRCLQSLLQWLAACAHGSRLDRGVHPVLRLREAIVCQPMAMVRAPDLRRFESGS
jgi:hypothetical protein